MPTERYDLIVVGSGFAGAFLLHEYLRHAPERARVLLLERGQDTPHRQQVEQRRTPGPEAGSFVNRTPIGKRWRFSFGVGGSSQCWWACTPRMLPADFELSTRYGVGRDWPVSYDELEESYCRAEELMAVSGPPNDASPFARSRPYPLPPHRLSAPDRILQKAYPGQFFHQPTARASRPVIPRGGTVPTRGVCCGSGVCTLCPVDAKFTVLNGLSSALGDPRVRVIEGAEVRTVSTRGDVATGVTWRQGDDGKEHKADGDLVALAANGLFNPAILLRSGLDGPQVGRGLVEQASWNILVRLDGVDNFDGGTSITGHAYHLYDGDHRRDRAAALLETWNVPQLRPERGKWRQLLRIKAIVEDLRHDDNRVTLPPTAASGGPENDRPIVTFERRSAYTQAGIEGVKRGLDKLLAPLPVEGIRVDPTPAPTEAHILGTTVMGDDPESSVVDRTCVHHRVRNLLVLGTSTFPTAAPANPTLTLCAHVLWSAGKLFA
jgi:choline dehydrogenase-like flavoprotein